MERRGDLLPAEPTTTDLTEAFVRCKLEHLLAEIGADWPRPCEGFLEFIRALDELRELGVYVDLGVLTNGHDQFVAETLDTWGLEYPGVAVTDEDIRRRKRPKRLAERVKPAIFPFNLAMRRWRRFRTEAHPRQVIYFGDDPHKDGGLATNAGVPFGWFTSEEGDVSPYPRGSFRFSDWNIVGEFMISQADNLLEGTPLGEIFALI